VIQKLSVFFCTIFLLLLSSRSIAANTIQLIVRGDDLGMTQGSIIAFERAFNDGVLNCFCFEGHCLVEIVQGREAIFN